MTPTEPIVTAVIVTYNSEGTIAGCLAGLVGDPRVEVIVVDSGSTDRSVEIVNQHRGVVSLPQPTNVGWTRGGNLAAAQAQGRALAFVNPDTRADADALVALAARLGPGVGTVAPRFLNDDGSPQHFYFRFATARSGPFLYLNSGQRLDTLLGRPVIRRHLYGEVLPVADVDHAGAACLVMEADVFRSVGGFDESMHIFFSDMDMSRRLREQGRRTVVAWDVTVPHLGGGSVNALALGRRQLLVQRDYVAYARVAYGPAGRLGTVAAVLAFSGLVPALMALGRGRPAEARACLRRAREALR